MPDGNIPKITVRDGRVVTREGTRYEFKESFNWANKVAYAKTIAAFANNDGGFLVFGIKDSPKEVVGINGTTFDAVDEQRITRYLNGLMSPAISYEKGTLEVEGNTLGFIHVAKASNGPVVAVKADGEVQEAAIYYRYNATTEKIKYPELRKLLDDVRDRERREWMAHLERIAKIGPENAAVMNVANGKIEGSKGTLLIDRRMIPKLRFIKEGSLRERGRPVLKLVGTVEPAAVADVGAANVRVTTDVSAPVVRVEEDTILRQFSLDYNDLRRELRRRYTNFKSNSQFHALLRRVKNNPNLCRPRYLDPRNPRSGKKDFYHPRAVETFDGSYTRR